MTTRIIRQVLGSLFLSALAFNPSFPQSTLPGFIEVVLKNSPRLIEQKNNLKLASLDSALFRASLKTRIFSQNDGLYYPVVNGFGYDEIITNGQELGVLINFDKQVLFRGQFNANMNSILLNRNQAENSLKITEKDLVRNATDLYLTAYGDYLQWQYNRDIANLMLREDSILQALTRSNIYRQTDYLVFQADISKQRLASRNALLQYKTDLLALRYESGISDTSFVELAIPELGIKPYPENQNSIFFKQYTLDSMQLLNQVDLISAEYKPQLKLHADAGYLSSLVLTPYKNFGAGIGMSLLIPIYDGRGQQIKKDRVQVLQDNLLHQKSYFAQQYDLQTRQLTILLGNLRDQTTDINTQLKFYDQLIPAERKLLSIGQLDIQQYFVVIQNYIDLKNQETVNKIRKWMITNQINYLAN